MMRTSIRATGALLAAVALGGLFTPAAGAATVTDANSSTAATLSAAVPADADWWHPCRHRDFREDHPFRCHRDWDND